MWKVRKDDKKAFDSLRRGRESVIFESMFCMPAAFFVFKLVEGKRLTFFWRLLATEGKKKEKD